jgi:fucose permease
LLQPGHGTKTATTIALGLYVAYNVAATASIPDGRVANRIGPRGPILVLAAGVAAFAAAYALFAAAGASIVVLAVPFVLAGAGIGAVETAENLAVASLARRRSGVRRSGCWPPSRRSPTSLPQRSPASCGAWSCRPRRSSI